MPKEKRSTKFGAALIIFALCLRLLSGIWELDVRAIRQPEPEQTQGSLLRPTQGTLAPTTQPTAPPVTTQPPPQRQQVSFTAADMDFVQVQYAADCPLRPALESLLTAPFPLPEAPVVLILHTHTSESYTRQRGEHYEETADYRTLNEAYNMLAVGDLLAEFLTEAGIRVIHDRTIHDHPSYTAAYSNARESVRQLLRQYGDVDLVLDLHRDAAENPDGSQYGPTVSWQGETMARLMLVVGTNASGNYHPAWKDNLATALKLQVLLEKAVPGITRPVILRAQRFNHDLSAGAMIVEVGAAGNSRQEALNAIPVLAEAVIALLCGQLP